ncbi:MULTISPECIES: alpha/beta fold hydrolase [unclassified Streptomyces]|uniref:thioesterase II family protein n=1 Tax=unclassified Streptomyces TaxID=2593676 RepID=UPI0033A714FB
MTVSPLSSGWLRRFSGEARDGTTLVCFPHAGGAASTYFPMSKLLAPLVGVCAVQYPGRQDRRSEPPLDDMAELADRVTESLAALDPGRPLALFGHSMGALLAYEVTRRLEAAGRLRPVRLIVSGRRAPGLPGTRPDLHGQDDETLLAELRRISGTAEQVLADEELVRMLLPTLRFDYKAVECYVPPAPGDGVLSCPISVFTGTEDDHVSPEEAAAWEAYTTDSCDVQAFPGGHFFLQTRREEVASAIVGRLRGRPAAVGRRADCST